MTFYDIGVSTITSTLSILVLTLYRILPRLDSCMHNFLSLKFDKKTFKVIISHLNLQNKDTNYHVKLIKDIKIKNVEFNYKNEKKAFWTG